MNSEFLKNILVYPSGKMVWRGKEFRVALGNSGVVLDKKEGDEATPAGCFPTRKIYYRADRIEEPVSTFPTAALARDDGWCDDPKDKNYNQHVKLPYPASTETLWREDHIYDIVVTLGYNDEPPIPEKGSAIFIHIARENYSPTNGCIALTLADLLEILANADAKTKICVVEK